jgi:hypothetical protein
MITVLAPVRNESEASALFWTLRCQTERRWALWCTAAAPTSLREFETLGLRGAVVPKLRCATYPRGTTAHEQLTPLVKIVATPLVLLVPPGGLIGSGVIADAVSHIAGTSHLCVSTTDSDHGLPPNANNLTVEEFGRSVLWVSAVTLRRAWTADRQETLQRLRELTTCRESKYMSGIMSCVT